MRATFLIILFYFISKAGFGNDNLLSIISAKSDTAKLNLIWKSSIDLRKQESAGLISIIDGIKQLAERKNDFLILRQAEIAYASVDFANEKYNLTIPRLNTLLKNNTDLTSNDSIRIYYMLKNSYVYIKNPAMAFESHKILSGFHHRGLIKDQYLMNPPLSIIYMDMGLYYDGIEELRKEFSTRSLKVELNDLENGQFHNNLGVFFRRWGIYDSALVNFNKASVYTKKLVSQKPKDDEMIFFAALVEGNKGSVFALQGKYADAIPLIKNDYETSLRTKFYESAANALLSLADCYRKLNETKQARVAIDSAFYYFNLSKKQRIFLEAYKVNAEVYAASGNFKKSADEFQKYIHLKDSLYEADKQIQLINNQVAYEVAEKENELKDQRLKIEEDQRTLDKNKSDKIILIIAIAAALLISVILLIANKNSAKKQKELERKNDEISSKNKLIKISLAEKESLIKEVHHRVKNNLQIVSSLLRLQSSKQSEEYIQVMFEESVKRIRSMALVHELLYKNKNIASIPIHTYIENLVNGLYASFGYGDQIKINVQCDVMDLDIDTTVPLGLIINELVTNSIKHAFEKNKGTIDVLFTLRNNKYYLMVKDNGKGLPENYESIKGNSLGMELVEALAGQLDAKYTYSSSAGSKFEFEF